MKKDEEKVTEDVNYTKKIGKKIGLKCALGVLILSGAVVLCKVNSIQTGFKKNNKATIEQANDGISVEQLDGENKQSKDNNETVNENKNSLNHSDIYYNNDMDDYYGKRLETLKKFMKENNIELKEIHDISFDVRMCNNYDFIKAANNGISVMHGGCKDDASRKLIDSCNGDVKMIYSYMGLSLNAKKRVLLEDPITKDQASVFFQDGNETFGMDFYLKERSTAFSICVSEVSDHWNQVNNIMNEKMCSLDEAQKLVDKEKTSPKTIDELDDCIYSIFCDFYNKYGIEDYYYMLDSTKDTNDTLRKEFNKDDYVPKSQQGGKQKTLK